jgi:peptide/nickel transport system substrate-binding protein
VPDLAVTLPAPVDGGRTYTFEVRRGVRYSSGQVVQPGDFRRAIERLFQVGVDGAFYYGGIVGASGCAKGRPCDLGRGIVTHQSARTVTFRLTAPDPEFLAKLALPFAFAVPPGTPARLVPGRPIPATGPYRVASLERSAGTLRLVRNALFRPWSPDARPPGYPDAIVFSFGEHGSNVRAVERGVADVALGRSASGGPLSKEKLERLAVRYPSRLHVNTTLSTNYYFLNTRVAPFDDLRVRRAVNLAFDREALVQMLGPGNAPTCQILPPNIPGYTPTCLYSSRGASRLSAARALVRSAGADGASVTVWIPSGDADSGRYMVSVLESIGLRAKLKAQSDAAHFSSVNDPATRAQTGYYGWIADFPSAAGFIPPQFSCDAGPTNVAGFCDRSIDALMGRAAASQSQDPAAATTVWQQVEREILAQAPIVPTYNQSNVDFVSKRVGNYQYNLQWGALLDQLWVK